MNEMAGNVRVELAKADNPGYVIGNPQEQRTKDFLSRVLHPGQME